MKHTMCKETEKSKVEEEEKKGEGDGYAREARDLEKVIVSMKEMIIKDSKKIAIHQKLIAGSILIAG